MSLFLAACTLVPLFLLLRPGRCEAQEIPAPEQDPRLAALNEIALVLSLPEENQTDIAEGVLAILRETTGADRVDLWQNRGVAGDNPEVRLCRRIAGGKAATPAEDLPLQQILPAWAPHLAAGLSIDSARHLPQGAERKFLLKDGLRTALLVPILLQTRFWGFLRSGDQEERRARLPGEEALLRSAGLLLASAL